MLDNFYILLALLKWPNKGTTRCINSLPLVIVILITILHPCLGLALEEGGVWLCVIQVTNISSSTESIFIANCSSVYAYL